jgi:hypothetical protein
VHQGVVELISFRCFPFQRIQALFEGGLSLSPVVKFELEVEILLV